MNLSDFYRVVVKSYLFPIFLIVLFSAPLYLYKFTEFKSDSQENGIEIGYSSYLIKHARERGITPDKYIEELEEKYPAHLRLPHNQGVRSYFGYSPINMALFGALTAYFDNTPREVYLWVIYITAIIFSYVVFRITKFMFGSYTAWIAIALSSTSYFLIVVLRGSQRSYVVFQSFFLWATVFYLFYLFIKDVRNIFDYIIAAIFISLTWFCGHMMHNILPVGLLVLALVVRLYLNESWRSIIRKLALTLVFSVIIYTALTYLVVLLTGDNEIWSDVFFHKFLSLHSDKYKAGSFFKKLVHVPNLIEHFYYTFVSVTIKDPMLKNHFDEWLPLMPMINIFTLIFAVFGFFHMLFVDKQEYRTKPVLWSLSAAIFLIFYANHVFYFGVNYPRQAILLFPFFIIMASYGIYEMGKIIYYKKFKHLSKGVKYISILLLLFLIFAINVRSFRQYRYQERSRYSFGYSKIVKSIESIWDKEEKIPVLGLKHVKLLKIITVLWRDIDDMPNMYDLSQVSLEELTPTLEDHSKLLVVCNETEESENCNNKIVELSKTLKANHKKITDHKYSEYSYLDRKRPVYGLSLYRLEKRQ